MKRLSPEFLHALDRSLIIHRPRLWRTKVHYVMFFSVIAILLSLVVGATLPQGWWQRSQYGWRPKSHPDTYFWIFFVISGVVCLIWAFLQARERGTRPFHVRTAGVQTTILDFVCFVAMAAPAFCVAHVLYGRLDRSHSL